MNVLVMNLTGNVGKSLVAKEVIFKQLNKGDNVLVEVENFNASEMDTHQDGEYLRIRPEDFRERYGELLLKDNVVVDVGVNAVSDMLDILAEMGFVELLDLVVVPLVLNKKEMVDTVNFVERFFAKYPDFDKRKFAVVVNRAKNEEIATDQFYKNFKRSVEDSYKLDLDENLVILEHSILQELAKNEIDFDEVADSKRDYLQEIKNLKNEEMSPERKAQMAKELAQLNLVHKKAKAAKENFQRVGLRLLVNVPE